MIKKQLIGAMALLVSMHFVSCSTEMEASFDIAKEKEGGQSAYGTSADIGTNVALGWYLPLTPGAMRNSSSSDGPLFVKEDSAWNPLPMYYVDRSAAGGNFGIAPMVGFIQKGAKAFGASSRENYLEGAVDLQYHYGLSDGGAVYGGLGPFIAYGLGGKTGGGANSESTFGGTDGIKRFDFGLNLRGGYQFASSLQFELGYDLGLIDRSPTPDDYTTKSRNFSISVGYSVDKIIHTIKGK
ncbi:MAG TPA: outer membrane beta-barrel protein [Puia sp.]|nr:outer membrane beta-barrel protein [Puia sp.]